jgi:hypothetical protein
MSAWTHGVMGLGAIGAATVHRPPLPPYKIGHKFHFILGQFKVNSSTWLVNAYSTIINKKYFLSKAPTTFVEISTQCHKLRLQIKTTRFTCGHILPQMQLGVK